MNPKAMVMIFAGFGLFSNAGFGIAATTYDLKTDFGSTSNPNGVWSYIQGGLPITATLIGTEYSGWGYSASFDGSIIQYNVSDTSPWHDLQGNDIAIHTLSTPYGGNTTYVGISWTSPDNGQVSISGRAWDASFFESRNANWTLSVGENIVASYTSGVSGLFRNDSAAQFETNLLPGMSLTDISVTAGEKITFLTQSATYYGAFMGVDMTATFTPVPIPAAVWLFGSALASLGFFGVHRNGNKAA